MFKMNRKIEYALIALKYMRHKSADDVTSAKEICAMYEIPFDPTSRVLQIMTQHGILHAEQGVRGGYQIKKDLSKISMRDLSDMLIGPIEVADCIHGNYSNCEITSKCHIIAPMLNLNEKINELFDTIMIADLIESKHGGEKNIRGKRIHRLV